jgi:hypothetical protein
MSLQSSSLRATPEPGGKILLRSTNKLDYYLTLCLLLPLVAGVCAAQAPIALHRGVNTFPWLYRARTDEGKGQTFVLEDSFPYAYLYTPEKLAELRAMGFDFVRMPVEPSPLLATKSEQRGLLVDQILKAVSLANAAGITVIVDLHPREAVPGWRGVDILDSEQNRRIYAEVLVEMAGALVKGKYRAVLEIMNEPPGGWSGSDGTFWQDLQREYVKAIRKVAPTLPLILTGARGGGIEGLILIEPSHKLDPFLFYSFHYYDPMVVTHQGATWTSKEYRPYLSDIPYPPVMQAEAATLQRIQSAIAKGFPDPADAKRVWAEAEIPLREYFDNAQGSSEVQKDMNKVTEWARSHSIPPSHILLGEFGIYRPGASEKTAAQYIKDVRTTAEHHGFAWAFFNYQPSESLPSFTMFHQKGTELEGFDPAIVEDGLGLALPRPKLSSSSASKP